MPRLPHPKSVERSAPSNPGLRKLVREKQEWHTPTTRNDSHSGFRGWHERGYLPHFDATRITQIVTFNLADSFPVERRREWERFLNLPEPDLRRRQLEEWLDRGFGACWLRRNEIAEIVEAELLERHKNDYELRAWTIMPNHVHLVVDVWETPLSQLIRTWKGRTAVKCNQVLQRRGSFWQQDYWDTFVRDARHLKVSIQYVERNPVKARLVQNPAMWLWSSARRRDAFGVLRTDGH